MVMVPLLSIKTTSTFPEVSTAFPLVEMTLFRSGLFYAGIPIAGKKLPIMVGMRWTSNATRTARIRLPPDITCQGTSKKTATPNITVIPTE